MNSFTSDPTAYKITCAIAALLFALIGIFAPILMLATTLRFLRFHPNSETIGRTIAFTLAGFSLLALFLHHASN